MAWWKTSSADRDINPDLAEERQSPSFNVETLTNLLDGGAEHTRLRRSVVNTIEKDPVFSREYLYFKTRPERYEGAIRNTFHLKKKVEELGLDDDGPEMEYVYRAVNGEIGLNIHRVFLKSLGALGTDEQIAKWMPLAKSYRIIGTYAQTELGHGTYLRGLETTATFDPTTQEFIIDTPKITATKWWPGDLGKTCTHALVLAQLHTKGKSYGMHPFIVPIRSLRDHSPLPGITVGDIGPKMSFEHIDNGYLIMRNIRIPKENMLSRFSEVLPDGSYVKRGSDKINYFTMIAVRVSLIHGEVLEALMKACTIAVRYSVVRRQSELKPGDREAKILDYQTQQQKLLPLVATCYAFYFMANYLNAFYQDVYKEIMAENFNSLPELHAAAAGLKAFATEICSNGVEVCRKACGGHGYSLFSGLPTLYTKVTASCTYEGENTVLHLQAARFLMKCFGAVQLGKALPPTTTYLSLPLSIRCQAKTPLDFLNPETYIKAYEDRAYRIIAAAAQKLHNLTQSGMEQHVAWNNTSVELVKASMGNPVQPKNSSMDYFQKDEPTTTSSVHLGSLTCVLSGNIWFLLTSLQDRHLQAHLHYLTVKTFSSNLSSLSAPPEIKRVLKRLCDLHALHGIFTNGGDFLQHGYLSSRQLELATETYLGLLAELRKDAVLLVDAFDFTDGQLLSALGTYDGNVYHNLMEWAQKNPDNKKVSPVFENYLKPYLHGNQSKL